MPNNSFISKILEAMKDAGLVVAAEVKTVAVGEYDTLKETIEDVKEQMEDATKHLQPTTLIPAIVDHMKTAGLVVAGGVETVAKGEFDTLKGVVDTLKAEIEELKKQPAAHQ